MSTRRQFLCHCATLAAGALIVPAGTMARTTPFSMKHIPLHELSYATLAAQVNTAFRVHKAVGGTVTLELLEAKLAAEDLRPVGGPPASPPAFERFSLLFRGPRDQLLEQRIHSFEHGSIGRFEMFIVPVASREKNGVCYEAIFNRPAAVKG